MATADLTDKADLLFTAAELTGRARPPLLEVQPGQWLAPAAATAFQQMAAAARDSGIELAIASSWRDFARQAQIVAAKLAGQRVLYDLAGVALDSSQLTASELLDAVLLYSALPGASRHHWGTDLDVYDKAAVPADYQLQLQIAEYSADGPFYRLSDWLATHAATFGFFRPYRVYQQGVAPEPWHLSYRPLANACLAALSPALLAEAITCAELPLKPLILQQLPALFSRYVTNICDDEYIRKTE